MALLQLAEVTDIKPVALPTLTDDFINLKMHNLPAVEVGYGWVDTGESGLDFQYDSYLHIGDEIIQDDKTIETLIEKYKALSPPFPDDPGPIPFYNPLTMLGATSPSGKKATGGDSGGPLLIITQNEQGTNYVQVGVTSSGGGVGYDKRSIIENYFKDEPTIFANLTNPEILDFINNTIKDHG